MSRKLTDPKLIRLNDKRERIIDRMDKVLVRLVRDAAELRRLRSRLRRLGGQIVDRELELDADRSVAAEERRSQRIESVLNEGLPPRQCEHGQPLSLCPECSDLA
jgi:hypothetical protein